MSSSTNCDFEDGEILSENEVEDEDTLASAPYNTLERPRPGIGRRKRRERDRDKKYNKVTLHHYGRQ
jgi:hypothetical protein